MQWSFTVPPVIMQPVGHTIASANDAAVIPCSVYSDPPPKITWYKGMINVQGKLKFIVLI